VLTRALAELDERTQRSWQGEVAPELEDSDEDEDPDGDMEPYTADAAGLADYLEGSVLPRCARRRGDIENRPLIRAQALGEALDPDHLEPLGRYEVHLDRVLDHASLGSDRPMRGGADNAAYRPGTSRSRWRG